MDSLIDDPPTTPKNKTTSPLREGDDLTPFPPSSLPPPPPSDVTNPITKWLIRGGPFEQHHAGNLIAVYAAFCSFLSYFSVYGFRKPWTSSTWKDQETLFGFTDPKLFLDWAQILGYVIGKFMGIFIVPSVPKHLRFLFLLSLPLISLTFWLSLALLHNISTWFVFISFFFSAMPLAMAWSLLYLFLEGRNNPDFLGAVLSASVIMGSSVAKAVGGAISEAGVGEYWMPFVTGMVYLGPFVVLAFLTRAIPDPSEEEKEMMTERRPMTQKEKMNFFGRHWVGLVSFTLPYILTTSARDFRDTFTVDIFNALGQNEEDFNNLIFFLDVPVGFFVCTLLISLTLIKDNTYNIFCQHLVMGTGYLLILVFQLLFSASLLPPAVWYAGVGVGIYMAFTPVGSMFYDRLGGALPQTEEIGTATFMIQVSDFCGYLGTIALYSLQGFGGLGGEGDSSGDGINYYEVLASFLLVVGVMGVVGLAGSFFYWFVRLRMQRVEIIGKEA